MRGKTASAWTPAVIKRERSADGAWCVPGADHRHVWVRLPGTVGLFVCGEETCLWAAVCPGCLGSLDVALSVQAGIVGMELYWCPFHGGEVGA